MTNTQNEQTVNLLDLPTEIMQLTSHHQSDIRNHIVVVVHRRVGWDGMKPITDQRSSPTGNSLTVAGRIIC